MNRVGITAIAALLAVLSIGAGAPPVQAAAKTQVPHALRAVVASGVPGAAAVRRGPDAVHLVTAGEARSGSRRAIRLHDRFRIASVTKTFGAVLIMQLVEAGRLHLGDRVSKWLPGLLAHGDEITIAQLLRHTSGLPDYTKDPAFGSAFGADPLRSWTAREVLGYVADAPLEFSPGTRYHYSDTDNIVLGLVVEAVTGRSFGQVLHDRILRPLRLRDTSLPSSAAIRPPFVHGYQYDELGGRGPLVDVSRAINPTAAGASGAIVSSLADLSRFWRALLSGRLVKPSTLQAMLTPTVAGGGSPLGPGRNRAGLGIFAWRMRCGTLYGHTGSFPGYQLLSGATRNGRASIVVLANATGTSRRSEQLQRKAYEQAACAAIRAAG